MMNETTYQTHYVPISAWMVYQRQHELGKDAPHVWSDRQMPEFYLEAHTIVPAENGTHQLGAASPLMREKVQAVCQLVDDEQKVHRYFQGLIPSSVLNMQIAPEVLIWKVKAAQRSISFDIEGLGKGEVPCPNLIFKVVDNAQLFVFATKTDRIHEQTPLYRAPFPNIADGKVCLGSASRWIKEPETYEALMQQWESIFFHSSFNTDNDHHRAKQSLPDLWKPLMNTAAKFPKKQLRKTPLTLNDLLV
ncbi:MAG: hypothetical protein WBA23_20370 [Tunicatimonas sp.]|uniref:hypothetical protein n=1 Tax=Tunicatimonas sp. TaxID=1940096 RepID=UPI003C77C5D5